MDGFFILGIMISHTNLKKKKKKMFFRTLFLPFWSVKRRKKKLTNYFFMRLSSDFAFISKLPLKIRLRSTFTIVFGNHTIIYQEKEKKGSFLELCFYLFYLFNLSESFKKILLIYAL